MIDTAGAPTLAALAARHGWWIGPAVSARALAADPAYAETLGREFNVLTPENEMKWGPVHPHPAGYDFAPADAIVAFARSRGLAVHGHTLVWHNQNPAWLAESAASREAMIGHLRQHIATVAGRYAGVAAAWDVVNEAVVEDGSLRPTLWLERVGPDYVDLAFRAAGAAAQQARLLYNDYGIEEPNPKSDGVYRLLSGMLARGVPLHGVGFQMHLGLAGVDPQGLARNLQRFADLGLQLYVTEMDVRIDLPATAPKLARQAAVYRSVVEVCLAQPACRALQTWGFTDKYSWIPRFRPGFGAALLLDESYAPKPAYHAVREALARAAPRPPAPEPAPPTP
jgi:endo-1,4-beta-xylanase